MLMFSVQSHGCACNVGLCPPAGQRRSLSERRGTCPLAGPAWHPPAPLGRALLCAFSPTAEFSCPHAPGHQTSDRPNYALDHPRKPSRQHSGVGTGVAPSHCILERKRRHRKRGPFGTVTVFPPAAHPELRDPSQRSFKVDPVCSVADLLGPLVWGELEDK